jgi:hypothetical protein
MFVGENVEEANKTKASGGSQTGSNISQNYKMNHEKTT